MIFFFQLYSIGARHRSEKYKTAAFFVCCDDGVRENGSPEKAQKIYDFCAENGWTPISMKNDWLTVFGEGVTKKQ